ncbi:bifunctional 4-hydroxy-2-oxoglutarate aldolase/2-dehydro-3-deoxy-phosphogluconate aldolase [Steroidobacter sp.]|uniref:bifunctional 4-hydroxy-2-oxoglutarate aldolase/2-dehydro-3-deoxy-phosphogluconate aldolase n=1 Tax=Steroidobacter sp. TaxID=1978227 RepID=UPI001A543C73|nr:bifunctional 4-hydroxy-2-oxoglutarate aldolase/2-dehydro-3-deoxy-phosphogluconate aldolase [Steroidobacter sp.]MBL8268134.1 bifunctional 4-hydroxy-2-oxoglutarate aldolase/2-dehydro-3-deoxy-phosphogluconate aldolase [Steroidobacter sp.]
MNIRSILALAPVIPVLTIEHLDHAVPLARALSNGGLRVLEVTLRTPAALPAIEAMRKAVPEAVVGVGTLARPGDFVTAGNAGAQFGVSPGLTAEMAAAARAASFPMLPGIMTPTELLAGLGWGYDTFKLFPAQQAGGIAMLKALGAPFPEVVFCPTGGISRATAPDFLALPNVACVGGSWVAPTDRVRDGDWAGIEQLARDAASLAKK